MASNSARPNNQEDAEAAYTGVRYSTIAIGVSIVLVIWGVFGIFVSTRPEPHTTFAKAFFVILGVLFVICLLAALLNPGRWSFGNYGNEISIDRRRQALPWFAASVIITIALMIWVSGGAVNSSFSHFLGIICSLSIVLAKEPRPRIFITAVSIIAYILTALIHPLDPYLLTAGQITVLHIICFPISVSLALLAAHQRKEEPAMGTLPGSEPAMKRTPPTGEDASTI